MRARTGSGSDGECATSKRSSTALSVRLTCCPPGPSARRKRSVNSDSGMSMDAETRMSQRLRDPEQDRAMNLRHPLAFTPASRSKIRTAYAGPQTRNTADGPEGIDGGVVQRIPPSDGATQG